jgi:hypothetical protein
MAAKQEHVLASEIWLTQEDVLVSWAAILFCHVLDTSYFKHVTACKKFLIAGTFWMVDFYIFGAGFLSLFF